MKIDLAKFLEGTIVKRIILLPFIFFVSACVSGEAVLVDQGFQPLSKAEIEETFSGKTLRGTFHNSDLFWAEYLNADGTSIYVVDDTKNNAVEGRWYTENNSLCFIYKSSNAGLPTCSRVYKIRDRYEAFYASGINSGKPMATIIHVQEGNDISK